MAEEKRREFWIPASGLLAAALHGPLSLPDPEYKQLKFFTPHVDACLRYKPCRSGPDIYMIIKAFSLLYSKLGRWEDAAKLNNDWLEKNKETLGDGSKSVLACMAQLSHDYWSLYRDSEAAELQQHILEAKLRNLGDGHPEVLEAMRLLAIRLKSSQPQKAVELLEHVSEVMRRDLGEEHPETLVAMNYLGISYMM